MRIGWSAAACTAMLFLSIGHLPFASADGAPATGMANPKSSTSLNDAAMQGLQLLRMIASQDSFKQQPVFRAWGFDSPEQASDLDLDRPLQVMLIPRDQLRAFKPGTDENSLLVPLHEILYPVIGQGAVRISMSVTFSQIDNRWKATEWGKPKLTRALVQLEPYSASKTSFLVRIPALNLHLLGDHVQGQLLLTPIFDNPRYGFSAGQSLKAEKAFLILQPAAMARDNLPG